MDWTRLIEIIAGFAVVGIIVGIPGILFYFITEKWMPIMSVIIQPTDDQVTAGCVAGRAALDAYSRFDSSMVPDDALETFVREVATAVLNAKGVNNAP